MAQTPKCKMCGKAHWGLCSGDPGERLAIAKRIAGHSRPVPALPAQPIEPSTPADDHIDEMEETIDDINEHIHTLEDRIASLEASVSSLLAIQATPAQPVGATMPAETGKAARQRRWRASKRPSSPSSPTPSDAVPHAIDE